MNTIIKYLPDILAVMSVIIILTNLYINRKKPLVKKLVLAAVVAAEKELGSKTGQMKEAKAISMVYAWLPPILKIFVSQALLQKLICEAVKWLHSQYNEGVNLIGYDDENKDKLP